MLVERATTTKALVKFSLKLSKRSKIPAERISFVSMYRESMKSTQHIMKVLTEQTPDVTDFEVNAAAAAFNVKMPRCVVGKHRVSQLLELIRFGDVDEFKAALQQRTSLGVKLDMSDYQLLNTEALELGLPNIASQVKTASDVGPLLNIQDVVLEIPDAVDQDSAADLLRLSTALAFNKKQEGQLPDQYEKNAAALDEQARDPDHIGILKSLFYSTSWKVLRKLMQTHTQQLKKQEGAASSLNMLAQLIGSMVDAGKAMLPQKDAEYKMHCLNFAKAIRAAEDASQESPVYVVVLVLAFV